MRGLAEYFLHGLVGERLGEASAGWDGEGGRGDAVEDDAGAGVVVGGVGVFGFGFGGDTEGEWTRSGGGG